MTTAIFRFNIEITEEGVVKTPGVDFGSRIVLVRRCGAYAVLRIPGGTHWSGLGLRSIHRARWLLIEITRESTPAKASLSGRSYTRDVATILEEEEPGFTWRATRDRLMRHCAERAAQRSP